jgi:prepilin-type N-terminal cleavage/methylation domain-containing protein
VLRLRAHPIGRTAGFTLIEILAVVLILALLATFVAPNLGALRERRLSNQAIQLAAEIELARQRSVVTGVPHRVLFDLEDAGYRIEWLGGGEAPDEAVSLADLDLNGASPLPLAAPAASQREFEPIPGIYGEFVWLEEPIYIAGLDTADGWIERGDTFVEFSQDGSASHTEIVMEDGSGQRIVLAVLPLDDAVRFVDEGT